MPRGPTVKCPFCANSLSRAYGKAPRSGTVVVSETLYWCRNCGATVMRGRT